MVHPMKERLAKMLDGLDNWKMNYDGSMREDINESKVKDQLIVG